MGAAKRPRVQRVQIGRACGARVDGALGPEGCGRLSAAGCVEELRKRVLKMDRPDGRRVLKFDGLSGRGLWYRPSVHSEHILKER